MANWSKARQASCNECCCSEATVGEALQVGMDDENCGGEGQADDHEPVCPAQHRLVVEPDVDSREETPQNEG